MFLAIAQFRSWKNRICRVLCGNGSSRSDSSGGPGDKMRTVDDRSHCAVRVEDDAAVAQGIYNVIWSEGATGEVLFAGQRSFGKIQRNIFEEPTEVVRNLGFS